MCPISVFCLVSMVAHWVVLWSYSEKVLGIGVCGFFLQFKEMQNWFFYALFLWKQVPENGAYLKWDTEYCNMLTLFCATILGPVMDSWGIWWRKLMRRGNQRQHCLEDNRLPRFNAFCACARDFIVISLQWPHFLKLCTLSFVLSPTPTLKLLIRVTFPYNLHALLKFIIHAIYIQFWSLSTKFQLGKI